MLGIKATDLHSAAQFSRPRPPGSLGWGLAQALVAFTQLSRESLSGLSGNKESFNMGWSNGCFNEAWTFRKQRQTQMPEYDKDHHSHVLISYLVHARFFSCILSLNLYSSLGTQDGYSCPTYGNWNHSALSHTASKWRGGRGHDTNAQKSGSRPHVLPTVLCRFHLKSSSAWNRP